MTPEEMEAQRGKIHVWGCIALLSPAPIALLDGLLLWTLAKRFVDVHLIESSGFYTQWVWVGLAIAVVKFLLPDFTKETGERHIDLLAGEFLSKIWFRFALLLALFLLKMILG